MPLPTLCACGCGNEVNPGRIYILGHQRRTTFICAIPECERETDANGLCQLHYRRWKKHGDPLWEPPTPKHESITSDGYRIICIGNNTWVKEHRWVMEQHIGRPLTAEEEVHHRDRNRLNNVIENLELCADRLTHKAEHYDGYRDEFVKTCRGCNKVLPRELFRLNNQQLDGRTTRCKDCLNAQQNESRGYLPPRAVS